MELETFIRQTYAGKKVFVTGHTGFKGSWLIMLLQYAGAEVKGYALGSEENSLYDRTRSHLALESVEADIRDQEKLKQEVKRFQPDYIFHLAAQSLVLRSYDNGHETFDVNIMGTVNVLEALRLLDKPCYGVIITTDKVYEQDDAIRVFVETDKLGGFDPYSASKACCELVVQSYHRSFFSSSDNIKIVSARAGNVIGGGDCAVNRIVPDLIRGVMQGQPFVMRNPDSVRPWQHVLDALTGYLVLGAEMRSNIQQESLSWNFGPSEQHDLTVKEMVDQFLEALQRGSYQVRADASRHEAPYLQLDSSLANERLGWQPRLNTSEAILWTAAWYKEVFFEEVPAYSVTIDQIKRFLSR